MSVQAMSWVIDHATVGGSDLLVMIMIANRADADGTNAFPSVPRLAKECRMSDRQVQRILHQLVEAGHLQVTGTKPSGTHVYRVSGMIPDNGDSLSPPIVTDGDSLSPPMVTSVSPDGDIAVSPEPSVTVLEPSFARTRTREKIDPHDLTLEQEAAAVKRALERKYPVSGDIPIPAARLDGGG